jgi:hypothetical protein
MDVVHDVTVTACSDASSDARAGIATTTGSNEDADATATTIASSDADGDAIATLIEAGSKSEDGRNNNLSPLSPLPLNAC